MSRSIWRKVIAGGTIGALLAMSLSLTLAFDGDSTSEGETTPVEDIGPVGVVIEPLDEYTKAQLRGNHLDFIAETGRIVTDENGHRQIVWDPPQLPTLDESIRMAAKAVEANDSGLLPLCTEEYLQYVRAQKEPDALRIDPGVVAAPGFPACNGIPAQMIIGPPSGRGNLGIRP